MSGRGEPRGGAGALGGATSHRGDTAEAGGTEGSGGRPRSRPEPRIPPPGCPQVQYRPIATGPKLGLGGAPGCPQPHFGLAARPLSPSGPVSLPTSHHGAMRSCAGPKGLTEAPPPAFFRGDSAQGGAGKRHSIWLRSVPPPQSILQGPYPLQKGLGHLYVPLPRKRGNHPKKIPLPAGLAWLGAALLREGAGLQRWGPQGLGGLFSPPHAATSLPGSS